MTSAVDVVNIALAEIGAQSTISSFTEGSPEADAAALLYQPKIDALFRAAPWSFARRQGFLTQLKAAIINGVVSTTPPPQPWLFEYAYPSDCIKLRYILPNFNQLLPGVPLTTATNSTPYTLWDAQPIRYQRATDIDQDGNEIQVLLTNVEQAQAVYTARIANPDLWDIGFLSAATSYLGIWLLQALARDRGGYQDQVKLAMAIINNARVSDGNESITTVDNTPDFILARGASGATANLQYIGYDALSWPGGVFI